jgi:hypothetical protein
MFPAKNHVIVRALLIAGLCLFAFDTTGGQARATIERNKAWNDMIVQFGRLHRDIEILGKFLVDHQTEYAVTEYDIPTLKAIDSAEEELKLAARIFRRSAWNWSTRKKSELQNADRHFLYLKTRPSPSRYDCCADASFTC